MTTRTKATCENVLIQVLKSWDNGIEYKSSDNPTRNKALDNKTSDIFWETSASEVLYSFEVVGRFCPKPADKNPALMSIYENATKKATETRLIGKPGKMIKRIFPYLNPQEVEGFANWYKETFVLSEMGYTVKSGNDAESFKKAYAGKQSKESDCNYANHVKSLSGSCMRHQFDSLPCHPAEVYAAGDFDIYWIEDSEGLIAARCIAFGDYAGPIYTNSNLATETLELYLNEKGITDFNCNFEGAKIKRIPKSNRDDSYVMPFVDGCGYAIECRDDSYWILTSDQPDCDYIESQTCGFSDLTSGGQPCDDCGDNMSEDDSTWVDNSESCVCSSCLSNSYTRCTSNDEYYPNGDMTEVFYYSSWGNITSDSYNQDNLPSDAIYCDNESEYWKEGDIVHIESESVYVPTKVAESDYFQSTVDSEWYPIDDQVDTELGDMTKEQAIEADLTLVGETYIRTPEAYILEITTTEKQMYSNIETVTTHKLILRDNFELDDSSIPQRNPDFFDRMRSLAISKL